MPVYGRIAVKDEHAEQFLMTLGNAVETWAAMQAHLPSVLDAARAFNTSPETIREAAEEAQYLELEGPDGDPAKQFLRFDQ